MKRWTAGLAAGISSASVAAPIVDVSAPTNVTSVSMEELKGLPDSRDLTSILNALPCPAQSIPSVSPNQTLNGRPSSSQYLIDGLPVRDNPVELTCLKIDDIRLIEIYKGQNEARAQYGSQPLVWDPDLARGASDYAGQLTTLGRVHASRGGRTDIRENLLQSLRGGRSPAQMVGVWTAEKQYFKAGTFPDVSTTGDWSKVGHYTQMIWPTTWRVGCGIRSDLKYDWTVCRYSPPGNRDGTWLPLRYTPALAGDGTAPVGPRPKLPMGGGMTQIDPPAPPPPPPPTARDDAPEGNEEKHPLVTYFDQALTRYDQARRDCDKEAADKALAEMRYALDELRKRLKAARKAGRFSAVRPFDVLRQIYELEEKLRKAQGVRAPDRCPDARDNVERG